MFYNIKQTARFQKYIIIIAICCIILLILIHNNINGYVDNFFNKIESSFTDNTSQQKKITKEKSNQINYTVIVKKGDNLIKILEQQHIIRSDINKLVELAHKEPILSKLQIGQKIVFYYKNKNNRLSIKKISITILPNKEINLIKSDNVFFLSYKTYNFNKFITKKTLLIESSINDTLNKLGVSTKNINKLINAFSNEVNFKRDIKKGDKITLIIEKFVNENNNFSHYGSILFASLNISGQEHKIYQYDQGKNSKHDYFSEHGQSLQKIKLQNPIKQPTRISSYYGLRTHPISGKRVMHKGIDFAAPVGTPIHATAKGVIEFLGWKIGYGNLIQIKHNNNTSTLYAHISKFTPRLKKGLKIKQGEIIGYVGISGKVTGPHLHYEVKINGKNVNPINFDYNQNIILASTQFKKYKEEIDKLNTKLNVIVELAEADINHLK